MDIVNNIIYAKRTYDDATYILYYIGGCVFSTVVTLTKKVYRAYK